MIPILEIIRLDEANPNGTKGILKINKELFCYTFELFDEENQQNISSIPAQQYYCEPYSSDRFPNTFQVMNVPKAWVALFFMIQY